MYGTAVVLDPTDCNSYLLFTVEAATEFAPRRAHYTRVRTNAAGNGTIDAPLGDVDPRVKNVQIISGRDNVAEGVYAVPKADESLESWVFIALRNQNQLRVFDVAASGVNEHATYQLTDFFPTQLAPNDGIFGFRMIYQEDGGNSGRMVLSVGRKDNLGRSPIGFQTFNRTTGTFAPGPATIISNGPEVEWTYGLAMSPDGTKLYYSDYYQASLFQYDFTSRQLNEIVTQTDSIRSGGLQNGPDGKIYWANVFDYRREEVAQTITHLAAINNPNGAGQDCDLEYNVAELPIENGTMLVGALPIFGSFPRQLKVDPLRIADCTAPGEAVATPGAGVGPFTYVWDNGETEDTARALVAGLHFVTVTSATGCTSTGQVLIESERVTPQVDITSEAAVSCGQATAGFMSLFSSGFEDGLAYNFSYVSPEGVRNSLSLTATENTLSTPLLSLGLYDQLSITAPDGCPFDLPSNFLLEGSGVETGLQAPVITLEGTLCPDSLVTLLAVGAPGVTYEWQLPGGGTLMEDRISSITLTGAGEELYAVIARQDTCVSDTSFFTLRTPDAFSFPTIDTTSCTDEFTLTIPQPEDFLSWEDGLGIPSREFDSSGVYTYFATSPTGCPAAGIVDFTLAPSLDINLPDSILAQFCEFVRLNPLLPRDRDLIVRWQLGGATTFGLDFGFLAVRDTVVNLTVEDIEFGCQVGTQVLINVPTLRDIYVPNAFSPNGDGVNDGFTLYHKTGATVIAQLDIFDRWGGQVVHLENIPVNQPSLGWDGKVDDAASGISVFVYRAVIRFQDGTQEIITGDVMLMR
ncbi:hypothetical protein A3850_018730 [Lewinella sp. 4G2]|nr:hypothetical protein A3850_018730 [Lewinella sp. 4G2]